MLDRPREARRKPKLLCPVQIRQIVTNRVTRVTRPTVGYHRVLRSGVLSGAAFAVTISGHLLAGGVHSGLGLTMTLAVMICFAIFATSVELSWLMLACYVAGGQVFAHVLLSSISGHTATVAVVPPVHAHHGLVPSVAVEHTGDAISAAMVFGHLGASAIIAVGLRYGEALYFRMARLVPGVIAVVLGWFVPAQPTGPVIFAVATWADGAPHSMGRFLLSTSLSRRGPPIALT